ncbi:MAG: hypothetical protein Q9177_005942 [Variospora cf. flavescens]
MSAPHEKSSISTMPNRSNPNTPTKFKRKTAGVLKSKRKHTQQLAMASKGNKVGKPAVPRTSQALRQSAPLSRKKARKLDKKEGHMRRRKELEKYLEADVEMKDLDGKAAKQKGSAETEKAAQEMEVD